MKTPSRRQIINEALKPGLFNVLTDEDIRYLEGRGWQPDKKEMLIMTIEGTPEHDIMCKVIAKLQGDVNLMHLTFTDRTK